MESKVRQRKSRDQSAAARKARIQSRKKAKEAAERAETEAQAAHARAVRKGQLIFYFSCFISLLGMTASAVPLMIKLLDKCYFSPYVSKFNASTTTVVNSKLKN